MKMLVFFRSREITNSIVSATKSRLSQDKNLKALEVDFINLDKKNYVKVLSQMEELPQYVYIWYDEEKVSDYIKENYPSIEVFHFNVENSIKKDNSGWYGFTRREYTLADLMIEKFKNNLKKKNIYQVDNNYSIKMLEMDEMDIANSKLPCFETEDNAIQYCIGSLHKDIERLEEQTKQYQSYIKENKTKIKNKTKLLKKYGVFPEK